MMIKKKLYIKPEMTEIPFVAKPLLQITSPAPTLPFGWLWLAVAMFVLPQSMQAEDYFQAKYTSMCFMVTPKGQGAVHIKVMHLDQVTGANGYLEKTSDCPDGTWIYAEAPGQKRRYIVSLYNNNDRSDDDDK